MMFPKIMESLAGEDLLEETLRTVQPTGDPDLDGLDEADPDPMIDEDGYGTITPEFDEFAMYEALEEADHDEPQADLPPREAIETMEHMAPTSEEEKYILDVTPFLDKHMQKVDAPEHDERLINLMLLQHQAVDRALEDAMYGVGGPIEDLALIAAIKKWHNSEHTSNRKKMESLMHREEDLERSDSDDESGAVRPFRALKRAGRGIARGVQKGTRAVGKVITAATFAPFKAVIKKFRRKLITRRAKTISWKTRRSKTPTKAEFAQARAWSRAWLSKRGGKVGKLAARMSGDTDEVGAAPLIIAIVAAGLPGLILVLKQLLSRASKEGAATTTEDAEAAPEEISDEAPPEEVTPPDEEEASGDNFSDYVLGRWR